MTPDIALLVMAGAGDESEEELDLTQAKASAGSEEEPDLTQGKASVEEVIVGPTGHVSEDPPLGETAVESFRFVSLLLCTVCFNRLIAGLLTFLA